MSENDKVVGAGEPAQADFEDRLLRVSVRESLRREFPSSLVSLSGAAIMAITHRGLVPDQRLWEWGALLLAAIAVRLFAAKRSLRALNGTENPMALVNLQAAIIFLNGVVWGSTMAFFHTGSTDSLFFVRLLVLGAGFAFTTGTLSVFLRTYVAFAAGIVVTSNIIMALQGLDSQKTGIIVGGMICLAAMITVVAGNCRRFRLAVLADIEKEKANLELLKANRELTEAMERISTLEGILPICAGCKSIRDGDDVWHPVEEYIGKRSKAAFSHSYCPHCLQVYHPEIYEKLKGEGRI